MSIENIFPLSPMQQGMLFHSLLAPESEVYVEQICCTLRGRLDVDAFEKAWQHVASRHEVLRSAAAWEGSDELLQVVWRDAPLPLDRHDWRSLGDAARQVSIDEFVAQDRKRGFDLETPPWMRLTLIQTGDELFEFIWTHHHILLDGWSVPVVLEEVFSCYNAFRSGRPASLERASRYSDYIAWLAGRNKGDAERFWKNKLTGLREPAQLPARGAQAGARQDSIRAEIPAGDLQRFARENGLTMGTLVQGAWALLLSRYTRDKDVLFGVTVSGRPAELPGANRMVGVLINTVPLRVGVGTDAALLDWLKALQAEQADINHYAYCSLPEIHGWSDVGRATPLFQSIVVFENYPTGESVGFSNAGLALTNLRHSSKTNFPINFVSFVAGTNLGLRIQYDDFQFERAFAERVLEQVRLILSEIPVAAGRPVQDFRLLAPEERQKILFEFNPAPQAQLACPIHELVASQPADRQAVEFEERSIRYGELNRLSNQIASYLQKRAVGPEVRVAIKLERSVEMVAAILGVLKAGGVYVPLDPAYPQERIDWCLRDCDAALVVDEEWLAREWSRIEAESQEFEGASVGAQNAAYIIYTSGSTGRPKGVMVTHGSLVNLAVVQKDAFGMGQGSRMLQFASLSFDASVWEIFMALANGGTLVLARREELMDTGRLVGLLEEKRINITLLPPSVLKVMRDAELPELRTLVAGGEACSADIVRRWSRGRLFVNAYGPTEITVCATTALCTEDAVGDPAIGRPLTNARVYVLGGDLQPVPVGVAGELYIGGAGVARGYVGRPDLTAERFVPDGWSGESGARLYRTGDLGRWREDGSIEFLGRIDEQVKLRGFRVELGEIEAVLESHAGVREAVVSLIGEGSGQRLAAWIVPAEDGIETSELQSYVREKVPEYMVPSAWALVERLPRLPNGKLDRRGLQQSAEPLAKAGSYVAPGTAAEEIVAGIWSEVLGLERVGASDNFFELGGHSLVATQVVSRLREAFGRETPLRWVFEKPTVAELARAMEEAGKETAAPPIERVNRSEDLPLSFAQERLWFLEQLAPGMSLYNTPTLVRMQGRVDVGALRGALNGVIARHEALRTVFESRDGRPVQRVVEELRLDLEVRESSEEQAAEEAKRAAQEPFDLARGPLVRARLWRIAEEEYRLLVVLHHIVCDGWSMGVLVKEVGALYAGQELTPLKVQYGDFAVWQREWLSGEVLDRQVEYWKKRLEGAAGVLELPLDHPRGAVLSFEGAREKIAIPAELAAGLRKLGRQEGATLFMVLAAGFGALLSRYTGAGEVSLGTPVANRTRGETEGLIGFFVNTLVLNVELRDNPGFRELLGRVRETALGAYAHQDLPFETLVEKLAPARDLSHTPLFQVMLVLNNTPRGATELPGLRLEGMESASPVARFELTLELSEQSGGGLAGNLEYNTALFSASRMQRLAGHLVELLESAAKNPEARVSELRMLGEQESSQLLEEWNETAETREQGIVAHGLVEQQAQTRPDVLALEFEEQRWSYQELNARANRMAHYLMSQRIGPGSLVALELERSPEMIATLLGVMKAGGAYVPLDPAYPAERRQYMLEDSRAALRINGEWLTQYAEEIAAQPETNPVAQATADDLAYVIYTSGSTGKPKGVMLGHRGLVNLALWQREAFGIGENSRVLQFAPYSFDASVWEIFMALASGGTLVLARQERLASIDDLQELLASTTTVTLPPTVLGALQAEHLEGLRTVVAAGEACGRELVERWAPGRKFFNAYGPTETTVCASMQETRAGEERGPSIGRGIANTRLYVLDEHLEAVPVGVPGELCVGGAGLARGYLHRPELTAERFIPDPYGKEPGARLYRTGDLVRWREDGELEYVGRKDEQVKVRGFRIEPGEVEAALKAIAGVREAVVEARGQRLVAWIAGEEIPPAAEMQRELSRTLPGYMVPAEIVVVAALPLGPTGKVDRKALGEAAGLARRTRPHVAPRTETESRLVEIWTGLLDRPVSVEDNFFELGGHSLLATQVASRIRQAFGIELPLAVLFEHPTLENLALEIERRPVIETEQPEIVRVARQQRKRSELVGASLGGK